MPSPYAHHWDLDPTIIQLNHGSFGACPRVVLEAQAEYRAQMEREPSRFFIREFQPLLDASREALAGLVGCDSKDLVFCRNATTAVNAVLRSLDWREGDELLVTDHGYKACSNAAEFVAERSGARVVVARIPFPVGSSDEIVDRVSAAVSDRTRVALIDHVTSPTGLVFPLETLVAELNARGVDVLVDGAHGVGMLDLDLSALQASWYTSNCHKWLCTPKGTAFLYTRRDRQVGTRPVVISHGASTERPGISRYTSEFDWTGTDDMTGWLCVQPSIEFLETVMEGGLAAIRRHNHQLVVEGRRVLCEALGVEVPCPDALLGSLATVAVPDGAELDPSATSVTPESSIRARLLDDYRIEAPVFNWPEPPARYVRLSAHAYNSAEQYRELAGALEEIFS